MPLILDTGSSSEKGRRDINSDACHVSAPDSHSPFNQPALLVIADSVSEVTSESKSAASCAVNTLRESFLAAPSGWELARTLKESFDAANQAVTHIGAGNHASTLSALVVHRKQWALGHIGDTRIWLYRDGALKQLTRDHTLPSMDMGSVVTQACGLKDRVDVELAGGELQEGDVFMLTSDGVHDTLDGSTLMSCLMHGTAQEMANALTRRALEIGSRDNVSACVVKVEKLPAETDVTASIPALPIVALPKKGETIDGYQIQGMVHKGRLTAIYKALDQRTGETVALRFPNPRYADDPEFIDAFLREEWIGKRLNNPHLIKILKKDTREHSALYSVLEYHRGENLAKRIRRKEGLSVREAVYLIEQLLDCLQYLHGKGVTHRDIKPSNILIDKKNKRLLLVGFGLSSIERLQDRGADASAYTGTKSYMAPEMLNNDTSSKQADIYSVGVTLYKMLTGKYPYGRVSAPSDDIFEHFVSPQAYNPDVPHWLSLILEQACAPRPQDRFRDAGSFARALMDAPAQLHEPVDQPRVRLSELRSEMWQWLIIATAFTLLVLLVIWFLR